MSTRCAAIHFVLFASFLCLELPAVGGEIVTPAGLSPGDQFRVMFVSSAMMRADSADIAVYDQFISSLAVAAGLGVYGGEAVTWQALGSTETVTALSRLSVDSPALYLLDGRQVASSGADLWDGSIAVAVGLTEQALPVVNAFEVYTGTTSNGLNGYRPLGGGITPLYGLSYFTTSLWVAFDARITSQRRFYGYSSILTVPAITPPPTDPPAVPEPSTLVLGLVSLAGLLGPLIHRFLRA